MGNSVFSVEQLIRAVPGDDERRYYRERASAYAHDCGCSWGAVFLLAAAGVTVFYYTLAAGKHRPGIVPTVLIGTLFVLCASVAGKLMGIGVARMRLAMLRRHLAARYQSPGA